MKTKRFNWGSLFTAGMGFLAITANSFSQEYLIPPAPAPNSASIQLYAGLTITNAANTTCSVEYTSDLSQSNSWAVLTNFTLSYSPYVYVDTTAPASASRRFYRVSVPSTSPGTTNPNPDKLVSISPGTFTMGEAPNTVQVTLTHGFYIAKNLVTQSEYQGLMGSDPSSNSGNPNHPVETVSWAEATTYCTQLTLSEQTAGRLPSNWAYRLPTEAEWEYACRAGTTTRFSFGDDLDGTLIGNYAWYLSNGWGMTHRVGTSLPNPWGLFDMHGNVHQWCSDRFDTLQGGNDPTGPSSGPNRVWRGGSYNSIADACTSFFRGQNPPLSPEGTIGFRVVAAPVQP